MFDVTYNTAFILLVRSICQQLWQSSVLCSAESHWLKTDQVSSLGHLIGGLGVRYPGPAIRDGRAISPATGTYLRLLWLRLLSAVTLVSRSVLAAKILRGPWYHTHKRNYTKHVCRPAKSKWTVAWRERKVYNYSAKSVLPLTKHCWATSLLGQPNKEVQITFIGFKIGPDSQCAKKKVSYRLLSFQMRILISSNLRVNRFIYSR